MQAKNLINIMARSGRGVARYRCTDIWHLYYAHPPFMRVHAKSAGLEHMKSQPAPGVDDPPFSFFRATFAGEVGFDFMHLEEHGQCSRILITGYT